MSLEINLLPEFGWSVKNQPVYGPGSVFQGFVKLNISETQLESADRLRIVFHATETVYSGGYATPAYHNQLFGSQKILWKRKDLQQPDIITPNTDISIPFIIQVPMVQFPPSSNIIAGEDGVSYHCNFILSAYLESQSQEYTTILKSHKTIAYMPFIETRISKGSVSMTTLNNRAHIESSVSSSTGSVSTTTSSSTPSVHVSMPSLDYVPGDTMPLTIAMQNIQRKAVDSVSIKLFQVQTWNRSAYNRQGKVYKGEKKMKQIIAQQSINLGNNNESSSTIIDAITPITTSLELPADMIPSFTYSPVFSIKYQLHISIKRKGKIWSSNSDLMEMPIHVGTLGYGIRSSEEIKIYSTFKSIFEVQQQQGESSTLTSNPILPVPKFLDVVEYEEALPVYNEDRLPSYDASFHLPPNNQHMNCIM